MAKVIGQYRCGCGYGPCEKKERLTYCPDHGEDIQEEYKLPKKSNRKSSIVNSQSKGGD